MFRVVILGAGDIGSAVHDLVKRHASVEMWDSAKGKVPNQQPLKHIIPQADIVFLCLPSWCTRQALRSLLPHLSSRTVVVSLAKGIEVKTRLTVDGMMAGVLSKEQPTALLLGPMLATEIRAGLKASAVVASRQRAAAKKVMDLFAPTDLRLRYSSDVRGAALASVLKNVYALSLGIVEGLEWGGNRKGWIAAQAIKEMGEMISTLDGGWQTAFSDAGVPDFIATGFSRYSKNRTVGEMLVSGKPLPYRSEGLVSLPPLLKILGAKQKRFLLLQRIVAVIIKRKNASTEFEALFRSAS